MTVDPWADKFCCQVETLYGPVDLGALDRIAEEWTRNCFSPADRPSVVWLAATGRTGAVVPVTPAVRAALESGDMTLTGDGFHDVALRDFLERTSGGTRRDGHRYERDVLYVLIGARHIRLVYSHLFGDETVFYPKSRRFLLAVSGRLSTSPVPPLNVRRDLTSVRLVGAAAHVVARGPRVGLASARRIVAERSRLARTAARGLYTADPAAAFVFSVTVDTVEAKKVPSVLFYCEVLGELGLPPTVLNHVVTDVRSYSSTLEGTDGNAVSHVPFTADWSQTSPTECARSIAERIRAAEPAVRVALSRVFGFREARPRTVDSTTSKAVPLATTMSYFRLPAGQKIEGLGGEETRTVGLQNPDMGVLAFNARDCEGRAHLTVSHRGGLIGAERVRTAIASAAARVGCAVTWELPTVSTAAVESVPRDSGVAESDEHMLVEDTSRSTSRV